MTVLRIPPHPVLTPSLLSSLFFTPSLSFYSSGPNPGGRGNWDEQYVLGNNTDWNADTHDLTIVCEIPEISAISSLFGAKGIAPKNANLLLALEWISVDSGWRLLGNPSSLAIGGLRKHSTAINLSISFPAKSIRGTGMLTIQLFLGSPGQPTVEESMLANIAGFRFGCLGLGTKVVVDGDGSLFPVVEEELSLSAPIWEFRRDWTDPFEEPFSVAFVSLALNTCHPDYHFLIDPKQPCVWTALFRQVVASWIATLLLELKSEFPLEFQELGSGRATRAFPSSIAAAAAYMLRVGELDPSSAASLQFSTQAWINQVMTVSTGQQ